MLHYFDSHVYTQVQADHARDVVRKLMCHERFFLHQTNPHDYYDQDGKRDYLLDPAVFGEAIELDRKLRELYANTKSEAISSLQSGEKDLGILPPVSIGNRQQVVCNRYNGGFEICRVYPLTEFASFAPKTKEELEREVGKLTDKVWTDFETLQIFDPNNHKCLVMLGSRISCEGSDHNKDFAQSIVADRQAAPFGLGYLFWKHSQGTRIVQHDHVVFGTSRKSHVNVQHWSDSSDERGGPKINFNAGGGYQSSVVFVTVL